MQEVATFVPEIPYQHELIPTDDGVVLAVQWVGEGPAVVLANGIGVTQPGLDHIVEHLRDRFRVITWDYRGMHRSALQNGLKDMSVQRHATDLLQVLDALGEERAAVMGWSMGVPVGLEVIRQAPDRVAGYGALFGAACPPFRAAFPGPVATAIEGLAKISASFPLGVQTILDIAITWPELSWRVSSGLGFVGRHANREIYDSNVEGVALADKQAYFSTMSHLLRHDARDVLSQVRCPAVAIAGASDWVTPPSAAEEIATLIPDGELVIIPGATHFGVIEYGPELWDPIDEMLARAFG